MFEFQQRCKFMTRALQLVLRPAQTRTCACSKAFYEAAKNARNTKQASRQDGQDRSIRRRDTVRYPRTRCSRFCPSCFFVSQLVQHFSRMVKRSVRWPSDDHPPMIILCQTANSSGRPSVISLLISCEAGRWQPCVIMVPRSLLCPDRSAVYKCILMTWMPKQPCLGQQRLSSGHEY